jgi:uncharacterized SAM-binding protein YcdF (DUF218 family)
LVLFTLLLLFFALFALWRRRRTQIAIAVAAFAWAIGAGWLATPLLDLAQHGYRHTDVPSFAPQTTMVLMGGGTARSDAGLVPQFNAMRRIAAIGKLYRECRETGASCKVILTITRLTCSRRASLRTISCARIRASILTRTRATWPKLWAPHMTAV